MDEFFETLSMLAVYGLFGWGIYHIWIKPMVDYERLLQYKDYVEKHPNTLTRSGVKCMHCGSQSIKSWGKNNAGDKNRIHICNKCGEKLYRTKL